jgi:predicted aspartyl protease
MRGLIVLSLLLSAIPAAAFAEPAAPPQACRLLQMSSLDMIVGGDGRIAVPAVANGKPIRMLVDTGDIYSGIGADTAKQLGLEPKLSRFRSAFFDNVSSNFYVTVNKFELRPAVISNFRMMVVPLQVLRIGTEGILAPNIMEKMDAEFDFAHAKFNLFSQNHCPHNVVYWTKDAYAQIPISVDESFHINVDVKVDGQTLHAVLDSGADSTIMKMGTAKSLFGLNAKSPGVTTISGVPINGQKPVDFYRHPFAAMSFGGVQVSNPRIEIYPDKAFSGSTDLDLIVGINVLRQLHLYIAYGEKMLYVTPAEAH